MKKVRDEILSIILFVYFVSSVESRCPTNVTCAESETCCETTTGLWGCCPFNNGICCQDGIHCCPNNQICLSNGTCIVNSSTSNHFSKTIRIEFNDIQCDDGSSCPDGSTCCPLASGRFGCCPIPNATCCSDHLHCCPSDHQCDDQRGKCKRKFSSPMLININEIVCPDQSSCPDGETCCRLPSGDYGCCPLVDAVCCNDQIHCCPHGSQCDVEHGQCLGEISIPWLEKQPSKQQNDDQQNWILIDDKSNLNSFVVCQDQSTMCPSRSFCCSKDQIKWKCCSFEDPIFCSNENEICPEGFQCDLKQFECRSNQFGSMKIHFAKDSNIYQLKQIEQTKKNNEKQLLNIIQCPDEKSFCPEETTCCQLIDGSYGCCPYSNGVCCSDKMNCCPDGYSCDQTGRCTKHFEIEIKKFSMKKLRRNGDQLCPDGKTRCSLNKTCCPNKDSNTYSCCSYSNGVCCGSNGSLCCPNNYQCDEKQLSCQLKGNFRSRSLDFDSSVYQCEDSNVFCSIDEICCPSNPFNTNEDPFACCPFKNGQCCFDGEHCCPQNTRCDLMSGDCITNN